MAGDKPKNLKKCKTVYVSLPASRRARSGGQKKTGERVQASAEKTMRKALAEGRGTVKLGPNTQVYVGGLIPTVHPEHVAALFADCGRILHIEFICTRGTANLVEAPLPPVPVEPIPGQLPTRRRLLRSRYIEENQSLEQRQTWMYAVVRFDDTASTTRALVKNGITLRGLEQTKCIVRVVSSPSDLEETRAVENTYAFGRAGGFPSDHGLTREDTEIVKFHGQESSPASSSSGSTETLRNKATADRLKWVGSEATLRPGQQAAAKGFWVAMCDRLKGVVCGISFKTTIA
ncbi:hypothetical protein PENSPDRAFT_661791 [Peniophora sp. CONT]|nr:hypothetical protein PENSPDRAFT_661791 [Peniophora sp. CONT]